jgi:ADP-heptose:LPS heptosyltransferase/glycosyltransferase involved in cell wall biosynthesis/tetratricopeptide (TPR) repeat protein
VSVAPPPEGSTRLPLHELSAKVTDRLNADGRAEHALLTDAHPGYLQETIANQAFASCDWEIARHAYADALRSGSILVDQRKCVLNAGRCALYLNDTAGASAILTDFVEAFPDDPEGLFYLGRSFQRAHRYADALACVTAAQHLQPSNANLHAAAGQLAHALAFEGFGHTDGARSGSYLAVAEAAFARALEIDPGNFEALSGLVMFRLDCGEVGDAIDRFVAIADGEEAPDDDRLNRVAVNFALALTRAGFTELLAGLECLERFDGARNLVDRARTLCDGARSPVGGTIPAGAQVLHRDPASQAWIVGPCRERVWPGARGEAGLADPWEALSAEADWVVPLRTTHWAAIRRMMVRLAGLPDDFAGIATFQTPRVGDDGPPAIRNLVIRKSSWDEMVSAERMRPDWQLAARMAAQRLRLFALATDPVPPAAAGVLPIEPPRRQRVLVLSRNGPNRLGGGEQFLADAARRYARKPATEVLFAGLTDDPAASLEQWPDDFGLAEGFLADDPRALRRFCIAGGVTAIHTISGLGTMVVDATAGLNIRIVYGVHFWREFVAGKVPSRPYFPRLGQAGEPAPSPSMRRILGRADFAYVNSDYCRDLAADLHRWRPPVLYSAPPPAPGTNVAPAAAVPQDYVLLANCRADKGWHLFLDIAAALPGRPFVAIAGQSDIEAALADVQHRSLFNVSVVERTDRMDAVYAGARVVVVPSFNFVETFSRVAVEAGRHGVPALLADAGNLSRLGAGTDLLLPERAAAWIDAVERLYADPGYAARLTRQAVDLSERFAHGQLLAELDRIPIDAGERRILVCVGSGIGNICHTTPMIHRLSEHFGCRLDVLVAGDFAGSGALLAGSNFVAQVFEDYDHVRYRAYDRVFITHCFGAVVPDFNSPRVHASRDFGQFEPAGVCHEAEFNLRFIEHAAGIAYNPDDLRGYFAGPSTWAARPRDGRRPRVALHAGSKQGVWAAKRWPHFDVLARELARRQVEVVSLGVPDEFVPGTLDRTGLTIERMAEELTLCDALVSNDSGVMNIANALGLPLVALFAPTNPVTRGPLHAPSVVLQAETDCVPCESNEAFRARFRRASCRCLSLISPARVIDALGDLGVPVAKGGVWAPVRTRTAAPVIVRERPSVARR